MSQHPSDVEMSSQPLSTESPKRGWFGRNWLWFVPTIILVPLFCCCGGPLGFLWYQSGKIFQLPPYQDSVTAAEQNPEVQQALGTPIQAPQTIIELFQIRQSGGTMDSGSTITLKMELPITGPTGGGKLVVDAQTNDGGATWTYSKQEVVLDDGSVIDLLPPGGSVIDDAGDAVDTAVDAIKDRLGSEDQSAREIPDQ